MNSIDFNPKTPLSMMAVIPADLQASMLEHNIHTIGQLLSATKGLTTNLDLFQTTDGKIVLEAITSAIPEEILEEYKTFEFTAPMGLIGPKNDEENENDENIPGQ